MGDDGDGRAVRRSRSGPLRSSDERFDAFVERRHAGLLRTAYLLTGDRGLAEDLLQTSLFATYRRWHRLRDQDDPTGYVRRVMVTTQTSWSRRFASREQVLSTVPELGWLEDAGTTERLHMWQALSALPARMRAVLVLRFYEDLSEAETARLLGCSTGTVKSQTSRGLARLRADVSLRPAAIPARYPTPAPTPDPTPSTADAGRLHPEETP